MHQLRIKRNRVRVVGVQGEPVTVAGVWQRGITGRGAMALEVGSVCPVLLPVSTAEQHDRVVHVPRHLQQAVGALSQPLQGAEPAQRRVYVDSPTPTFVLSHINSKGCKTCQDSGP